MPNLLVEIGNTALKAALSEGNTLGKTFRYQGEKKTEFILSLVEREKPSVTVIASIYDVPVIEERKIRKVCPDLLILDPSRKSYLEKYRLPDHLTFDRASALIAVRHLFNGRSCTLIDFGTTLTVDFLDGDGVYQGGVVSLGLRTRFKAIGRYSKAQYVQSSVDEGVYSGIMFEIQGYIDSKPGNIVVFTGGDAIYFAKRMKNSIFVVCNLVLMGLSLITEDYVKEKDQ